MATNEQVIDRIDRFEATMCDRFERNEITINKNAEAIKHNDEVLRGNGAPGVKARLTAAEKYINETKRWSQAIVGLIIADIVARVLSVI